MLQLPPQCVEAEAEPLALLALALPHLDAADDGARRRAPAEAAGGAVGGEADVIEVHRVVLRGGAAPALDRLRVEGGDAIGEAVQEAILDALVAYWNGAPPPQRFAVGSCAALLVLLTLRRLVFLAGEFLVGAALIAAFVRCRPSLRGSIALMWR